LIAILSTPYPAQVNITMKYQFFRSLNSGISKIKIKGKIKSSNRIKKFDLIGINGDKQRETKVIKQKKINKLRLKLFTFLWISTIHFFLNKSNKNNEKIELKSLITMQQG
jgi:hypothetical protein